MRHGMVAAIIRRMTEQQLTAFIQTVQEMFARAVREAPPQVPGKLFPPHEPPVMLVYFGEASLPAIRMIRDQLPSSTVLLWICPPGYDDLIAPFDEQAAQRQERTLHLVADDAWQYEEKMALLIARLPRRNVRLVIHQSFQSQFPVECGRIGQCIKRTLANLSMDAGRGLIFLRASLLNLGGMAEHALKQLPTLPPGSVALVCAAGPSLRRQLEDIRAFRAVGLIVAVGHAVPTLHKAGIRPHVVVEDDACAGINWPDELGMEDTLLVAASTVDTRVASRFDRIHWCQGSSPMFNEFLCESGMGQARMTLYKTVSAHAVEVAIRMGCMRVAMVGQDFSLGPSGVLHADGHRRVSGVEHLVDVPANEGGTVRATKDLAVLREALEEYIGILERAFAHATEKPVVVNCTEGGALIRGAVRMTLSDFCCAVKNPSPIPALNMEKCDGTRMTGLTRQMAVHAGEYAVRVSQVVEMVRRLRLELEHQPPRMDYLRRAQEIMEQAVADEKNWLKQHEQALWLNPLMRHADRLSAETPGLMLGGEDVNRQLCYLEHHYQVLCDLSEEVRDDLAAVIGDGIQPLSIRPDRDSAVFVSFKKLAVTCIRRANPELADWLQEQKSLPLSERFRFRWKNQIIPGMEVRAVDGGEFVSVAGEWSMVEDAQDEVRTFMERVAFDPMHHGMVVLAPCNWIHVLEMLNRHPALRLIVVEPWLDALHEQILHGCFLHRLPADALVVGADVRINEWKRYCVDAFAIWKKERVIPVFFTPRRVAEWGELRALHTVLEGLSMNTGE